MAEVVNANTGNKVNIFFSVRRKHVNAFSPLDFDAERIS
jgi:hypothetical protein